MWTVIHRAHPSGRALADRHYNRQKIGAAQFVPPGRCLVLLGDSSLWVTSWPYAQYVKHAWAGAWVNSLFRNEGGQLSSELIRLAVSHTVWTFGPPPKMGLVTFVDAAKIRSTNPGYCYKKAGFRKVGKTKTRGLIALQLLPEDMPEALAPRGVQYELLDHKEVES